MKFLLPLACLLATSQAFIIVPNSKRAKSEIQVASPPLGEDDWTGKPIPARTSTVPTPVNKVSKAQRAKIADRIIDPDYTLALGVFLLGPLIAWYHPCKCCEQNAGEGGWLLYCTLRCLCLPLTFRSPYLLL